MSSGDMPIGVRASHPRTPLAMREAGSRAAEVEEGEDGAVLPANAVPTLALSEEPGIAHHVMGETLS